MTEEKRVLDLDELFGQARNVKVKFGGREYELLRVEGLGPKALGRFDGLQKKAAQLQMAALDKDISDAQEIEIVDLFDEMLGMLCPDLPLDEMGFVHKARTLEFYVMETQGKNALDIVPAKGKKRRTGAMSSRS